MTQITDSKREGRVSPMKLDRPLIGLSMDFEVRKKTPYSKETSFIYRKYYEAIRKADAIPVLIPPLPIKDLQILADSLHGILLTGGDDLDPSLYGEFPIDDLTFLHPIRQNLEIELAKIADQRQMPLLGICLGSQIINVIRGGTLIQDIPSTVGSSLSHLNDQGEAIFHEVKVCPDSKLFEITQKDHLLVNTYHHQSIKKVGKGLVVNSQTKDQVIEGIEAIDHPFLMGFQWHLELDLEKQPFNHKILQTFVKASKNYGVKP